MIFSGVFQLFGEGLMITSGRFTGWAGIAWAGLQNRVNVVSGFSVFQPCYVGKTRMALAYT